MKKIFTLVLTVFVTLTVIAQPPLKRDEVRPLPNQFRDFVDHQQRWNNFERPIIDRKEGKVIITMTEQQFERMQMMRQAQRMRMSNFRQNQCCQNCQHGHQRPPIQQKF